jgi:hypothetical protein
MQLIHVERITATSDDQRLGFLLTARAKAAEQVVAANVRAQASKTDLVEHITRRLQDGADRLRLRHRLLESGMPPSIVAAIMSAATDAVRPTRVTGGASQQTDLPYGAQGSGE